MLLLQQSLTNDIFPKILGATSVKEAWDRLKEEFKDTNKVVTMKVGTLWRQLDAESMQEGKRELDFYARISNKVNQIRNFGQVVDDQKSDSIQLDEGYNDEVYVGDGKMHKIEGKGVVNILFKLSKVCDISEVMGTIYQPKSIKCWRINEKGIYSIIQNISLLYH